MLLYFLEVPNQKYKISTKTNKVYDLTERKVSNATFITHCYYCTLSDFCVAISVFAVTSVTKLQNIMSYKYRAPLFG